MQNIMKAAHKMTKEIITTYRDVDYKAQLGLCMSYLLNQKEEGKMKKELNFEKKGIQFCFRNFYWESDHLKAEWKVPGYRENDENDGYYFNATYYQKYGNVENVFVLTGLKIKGKKVEGVMVPNKLIGEINEASIIAKQEYEEAEKQKQMKIDEKFNDDTKIKISYHTTYKFLLGEYGESTRGKAMSELLENKKVADEVESEIKDFQTGYDWGDYSTTTFFEISVAEFEKTTKEIYAEVTSGLQRKQAEIEAKRAAIFAKAKETGEKQVLSQWSEECNNPNEECNVDNVVLYALPDGSEKIVRYHTW